MRGQPVLERDAAVRPVRLLGFLGAEHGIPEHGGGLRGVGDDLLEAEARVGGEDQGLVVDLGKAAGAVEADDGEALLEKHLRALGAVGGILGKELDDGAEAAVQRLDDGHGRRVLVHGLANLWVVVGGLGRDAAEVEAHDLVDVGGQGEPHEHRVELLADRIR